MYVAGTVGTVIIREVILFQRWLCTHCYVAGTVDNHLLIEVPVFSSVPHIKEVQCEVNLNLY